MARYYYRNTNQRPQNNSNPPQTQPNNNQTPRENQPPARQNQPPARLAFEWPIGYSNHFQRRFNEKAKQKLWQMLHKQDLELFDDFHPFGLVFFSNQILQTEAIHLFPHDIIQMLEYDSWTINVNSQDDAFMWERRFELMQECQMGSLEIKIGESVKTHYLLNFIEPIGFSDLIVLSLYSCHINNIEPLAHLNAPNLKRLNLIYNQVYSFKALNKALLPLKHLYLISTNEQQSLYKKIQRPRAVLDNFSRWNFSLEDLRLEKHEYNSIGMNDLAFLAKSKFPMLEKQLKVNVLRDRRIRQNRLIRKFKKETNLKFQLFSPVLFGHPQHNLTEQEFELYMIRN